MSSKHTDRFSDRRFLPISGENETRADVTTQTPPTAALSEKDTLFPQSSRSHSDYLLYFHIISSSRFISLCEFVQKETHTHTHRVVHQCGLECQTTGGRGDGALANLSHTHHTTCSPAPETVIGCSSVTPPPPLQLARFSSSPPEAVWRSRAVISARPAAAVRGFGSASPPALLARLVMRAMGDSLSKPTGQT